MFNLEVNLVIVGVIGYLLGSANTSLIVGKFYGVDVRKHGSGSAGMTNTLRTLGKTAAAMVAAGDILKGIISCLIGLWLAGDTGLLTGGILAIIGHNWPVYFGFKGGKGILTSLAVIIMMDWKLALILFGVFLIIVSITRYISLGSIIGSALLPVSAWLFHKNMIFIIYAAVIGLLAIVMHRSNIRRLLNGTESKLGQKKNV